MNFASVIVLLIVAAVAGLALRSVIKDHKSGGCSGNCGSCGAGCNITAEELEKIKIEK